MCSRGGLGARVSIIGSRKLEERALHYTPGVEICLVHGVWSHCARRVVMRMTFSKLAFIQTQWKKITKQERFY